MLYESLLNCLNKHHNPYLCGTKNEYLADKCWDELQPILENAICNGCLNSQVVFMGCFHDRETGKAKKSCLLLSAIFEELEKEIGGEDER